MFLKLKNELTIKPRRFLALKIFILKAQLKQQNTYKKYNEKMRLGAITSFENIQNILWPSNKIVQKTCKNIGK
ncbi:MAG: hypothetical protein DRR08_22565 [Candidatus Parabeggiatoa sp. nov. 2]|nr:MAG: hypothetical protein B6247_29730 [Beggiatoa sp. 4572_84]RKZ56101.1 MAG: hypothetical protein DRR08_22565 [Gammaproteobacteria bacterium]